MAGDISERIPVTTRGDEFDRLAMTLNGMLGKVEDLIIELRITTESIAHDLRSPLTRLRGHIEQSLSVTSEKHNSKPYLDKALIETDQILKNLNALLSIARLELGIPNEQMCDVPLKELLENVCDFYAPLVEENEMELQLSISLDDMVTIKANAQLIIQAIANLIENAINYAGKNAKIRIMALNENASIVISVSDNGPGIPEHERVLATQKFIKLSPERKALGMGLGLYLVTAIAKIHGAIILLEDNNPGLKISFIFQEEIHDKKSNKLASF